MPKCRSCGKPIIFLTTEPGKYPASAPTPIDIDPTLSGNIAIYESPNPNSVFPDFRDFAGIRKKYYRRLEKESKKAFIRFGGVVYSCHFETCPARR